MYYFAEVVKHKNNYEITKTNYKNINQDIALAVLSQALAGNLPDGVVSREVKGNSIYYRVEAPQSSWDEWIYL